MQLRNSTIDWVVKYLYLTNLEAKYKMKVLADSVSGGRSLPDLQAAGFDAHMVERERDPGSFPLSIRASMLEWGSRLHDVT